MKRNFYELLMTHENSYVTFRCLHLPKNASYLGKFMDIFDILQLLGIKFLEMYQVSTALFHFSVVIMKFLWSENFISWRLQVLLFL